MGNIIIRCRANSQVGFGHLVRSRVLTEKFHERGFQVILVGPSKQYMTVNDKRLFREWIEREEWQESKEEALYHIDLANQYDVKHLIMDDYRSDYTHQLLLRKANLRILQQYDASKPQRFAANIVVNGSPFEKKEFYEKDLYDKNTVFLHGPKYAILRKDFLRYCRETIVKENKLLVTFGGGDDHGAIIYILKEIASILPLDWSINMVVTQHNPNIDLIQKYIADNHYENATLMVNPSNMVDVIGSCKLGVLSGGTTTFEAAYLGTPSLLIPLAKNQYNQGIGWDELEAMVYLKPFCEIKKNDVKEVLSKLLNNEEKIEHMKKSAMRQVDGLGADRLVNVLIDKNI